MVPGKDLGRSLNFPQALFFTSYFVVILLSSPRSPLIAIGSCSLTTPVPCRSHQTLCAVFLQILFLSLSSPSSLWYNLTGHEFCSCPCCLQMICMLPGSNGCLDSCSCILLMPLLTDDVDAARLQQRAHAPRQRQGQPAIVTAVHHNHRCDFHHLCSCFTTMASQQSLRRFITIIGAVIYHFVQSLAYCETCPKARTRPAITTAVHHNHR